MRIPCVIMRGGTSRTVFVQERDLPADSDPRTRVILALLGSPDNRQINGLGGATSSTSKIAIIRKATSADADVDYLFGQVAVDKPLIDYSGNSGNTASAVGVYAVEEKLVASQEPYTPVRIRNVNSGKLMVVQVPVKNGAVVQQGSYSIPGVPGTSERIAVEFLNPTGSATGVLLPTGKPRDILDLGGERIVVSMVDAGNPVVFVRSGDLDIKGTELPDMLNQRTDLLERLERIRQMGGVHMGIKARLSKDDSKSLSLPYIAMVTPAVDYVTSDGIMTSAHDVDLVARACSMQKVHQTYMGTCAVCTAVSANIPGTVVSEVAGNKLLPLVRIGHPYGVMDVDVRLRTEDGTLIVERAAIGRTARRIMEGYAYV